jgi:hypothetical protein
LTHFEIAFPYAIPPRASLTNKMKQEVAKQTRMWISSTKAASETLPIRYDHALQQDLRNQRDGYQSASPIGGGDGRKEQSGGRAYQALHGRQPQSLSCWRI